MTGIIIQARMGSTRLPGKVLMKIGDKSLLKHIIDRLDMLQTTDCKVVVATTKEKSDDEIEKFCDENAVPCFRGNEKNVLNRYWMCALQYGFDDIVRLTADNPFVDITELERLIEMHRSCKAEYSYSDTELPEGLGAEVFSRKALQRSVEKAYKDNHFEHVDDYILENMEQFICRKLKLDACKIHPEIQFTVDTKEQLEKACFIAEHARDSYFGTVEAIQLERQYTTLRDRKK
ncbi:MAG: acylneuraminate cytidylyltransferase [Lachnospiraceae bacterium]|nr:acylneuraminate cytidylyltransferase [Lachnospiraceae bacterium]